MYGIRKLESLAFALVLLSGAVAGARADGSNYERLVQSTTEVRTYLYFKGNSAAVQRVLPAGWVITPGTGVIKDANFFVFLVEGLEAAGVDGTSVPNHGKFAVLAVPAKNEKIGAAGAVIVGGFVSQPQAAPGVYGVYAPAKIVLARSSRSEGVGPAKVEESWDVSTEAGDTMRFVVAYERALSVRGHVEPRVYSGAKQEFYRIYKADQVVDFVHSVPTNTKRATKLEFSGAGPQLSKILDGSESLVAVASIPAYSRQIFLPE